MSRPGRRRGRSITLGLATRKGCGGAWEEEWHRRGIRHPGRRRGCPTPVDPKVRKVFAATPREEEWGRRDQMTQGRRRGSPGEMGRYAPV
jgi:hypothetical protein